MSVDTVVTQGAQLTVQFPDGLAFSPHPVAWLWLAPDQTEVAYYFMGPEQTEHRHKLMRVVALEDSAYRLDAENGITLLLEPIWRADLLALLRAWMADLDAANVAYPAQGARYADV